jgi:anti-sigma factor RsiW
VRACAAFEDLLIEYDELSVEDRLGVDAHVIGCASCREYLAVVREIDTTLTARGAGVRLRPEVFAAVRQRVHATVPIGRMSAWPEWLDFIAIGAIVAFACGLVWTSGLIAYVVIAMRSAPN